MNRLDFYVFENFSPILNMEIDNFFLKNHEGFVFRLYGWKPYGVSIGFSQKKERVCNVRYCEDNGIAIVRRTTGGGAVFHKNDITYMFSCPLTFFTERSVVAIYREVGGIIISILKRLGLNCEFAGKLPVEKRRETIVKSLPCFALPSDYEMIYMGKKVVGNALRIERDRILQHGSIAFDFDYRENAVVLNSDETRLRERVISLKEIDKTLTIKRFQQTCIDVLKEMFEIRVKKLSKTLNRILFC